MVRVIGWCNQEMAAGSEVWLGTLQSSLLLVTFPSSQQYTVCRDKVARAMRCQTLVDRSFDAVFWSEEVVPHKLDASQEINSS